MDEKYEVAQNGITQAWYKYLPEDCMWELNLSKQLLSTSESRVDFIIEYFLFVFSSVIQSHMKTTKCIYSKIE